MLLPDDQALPMEQRSKLTPHEAQPQLEQSPEQLGQEEQAQGPMMKVELVLSDRCGGVDELLVVSLWRRVKMDDWDRYEKKEDFPVGRPGIYLSLPHC